MKPQHAMPDISIGALRRTADRGVSDRERQERGGRSHANAAATAAAIIWIGAVGSAASAGIVSTWIGPDGGAFDVPRHWSDGVPGPADTALFMMPGSHTVFVPSGSPEGIELSRLLVRNGDVTFWIAEELAATLPSVITPSVAIADESGSTATLTVESGILRGRHVVVGHATGANGTLVVASDAALVAQSTVGIGAIGAGLVELRGELTAPVLEIGTLVDGEGTLDVVGGTVTIDALCAVANFGTGSIRVSDGGRVVASEILSAITLGASASMEVTGRGSELASVGVFRVAKDGLASLSISDGGSVVVGGSLWAGFWNTSSSTIVVEGPGSRLDVLESMTMLGPLTLYLRDGARLAIGGNVTATFGSWPTQYHFRLGGSHQSDDAWFHVDGSCVTPPIFVTFDPEDPPFNGDSYFLIDATQLSNNVQVNVAALPWHDVSSTIVTERGRKRIRIDVAVPSDLNGDGATDGADLGILLESWGPCAGCPADLDGNGVVDGSDLGILLSLWNPAR